MFISPLTTASSPPTDLTSSRPRRRAKGWIAAFLTAALAGNTFAKAPTSERATEEPSIDETHIERLVRELEYAASESAAGLQAPNRQHGLRTYFDGTGIRVVDRMRGDATPLVGLKLASIGRGERIRAVGEGELKSLANRVEIRRPGLTEWYVNSSAGLEQGFVIDVRPEGKGPLSLQLEVSSATASQQGDRIRLTSATGRVLDYGKLFVVDATGATIESRMRVTETGRIELSTDDPQAVYPLTIDPLLTSAADTVLDSIQNGFARRVMPAGDVNGDGYDDVLIASAYFDLDDYQEGAVFIFHGSPSGVTHTSPEHAHAVIEGDLPNMLLGRAVSSAGDVNGDGYDDIIIGLSTHQVPPHAPGGAFLFYGSASGITSGTRWTADAVLTSTQDSSMFGWSVAGAGDVNGDGYDDVIVGAPRFDSSEHREGIVLVFHGSATGIQSGTQLSAQAYLESEQVEANLGREVAAAGDVNGDGYDDIVGVAPNYLNSQGERGAAFIYHGGPAGVISHGFPSHADTVIETDANATVGTYGIPPSIVAAGDLNGDGFDELAFTDPAYSGPESNEGAVFLFEGTSLGIPDSLLSSASTRIESDAAGFRIAESMASAGDLDGDGFDDLLIERYAWRGGPTGIASGNLLSADLTFEAVPPEVRLGFTGSSAGDVNGDGFDDAMLAAGVSPGDLRYVFIFHGEPGMLPEPGFGALLAFGLSGLAVAARAKRTRG